MSTNDRKSIITILIFFEIIICGVVAYWVLTGNYPVPERNTRPGYPIILFALLALPILIFDQFKKLRQSKKEGKS